MIKLTYILKELNEARSQSTTRRVRDVLVSLSPDKIRPSKEINRVYAPDLTSKDFEELIKSKYNTDIKIISPKSAGSLSSKFDTFVFSVDGSEVAIVLAKGILAGAAGEEAQIQKLQSDLDQLENIDVEVAGKVYKDIVKIEKVAGFKKADFQLVDSSGKAVVFIQHKSPEHQQMSGISKLSKQTYPEIAEFVERVREVAKTSGDRLAQRITAPVENPDLQQLAAYGTLDGSFGPDAIQLYCIGDLKLVKAGKHYKVQGSQHTYEYPEKLPSTYHPTLVARYSAGRNQEGIPNVRFGIYPKDVTSLLETVNQPSEKSKMKNFLYRGTRDQIDLMKPYDDSSTRYSKMKGTIETKDPAPVEHPENKERVVGWKWDEPYTLEEYGDMELIANSVIGRELQTLESIRKIMKRLIARGFKPAQVKAFMLNYLNAK